jgi:transposase
MSFFGMKPYSLDLRERVIATIDEGEMPRRLIAQIFRVSYIWIKKILRQRRNLGHFAPLDHGGGQKRSLTEESLALLRRTVLEKPDSTLEELRQIIDARTHQKVSISTISRELKRLNFSRKKKDTHRHGAK